MKKIYRKIVLWLEEFKSIELMAFNILIMAFAIGITILNFAMRTMGG